MLFCCFFFVHLFCLLNSCSIACFKKHKEAQCTTPSLLCESLDAARVRQRDDEEKRLKEEPSPSDSAAGKEGGETVARKRARMQSTEGYRGVGTAQGAEEEEEGNPFFKPRETESTYSVSEAQLRSLWQNTAVVQALGDARLKQILTEIDELRDPHARERALDDAVTGNPDFAAFVNTVLQTIGVRDIEGNCTLT